MCFNFKIFAAQGESKNREVEETDGWKGSWRAGEGEVRGQDLGVRGVRGQGSGKWSGVRGGRCRRRRCRE